MKRANRWWKWLGWTAIACLAPLLVAASATAQATATIIGEVRDTEGKLFPGVLVVIKHEDSGQTIEVRTDRNGRFIQVGLRPGNYLLSFKVKDARDPKAPEQTVHELSMRLGMGTEERISINFKELLAKETAAMAAARKKAEEERNNFESMKSHFDSGKAAMDQTRPLRDEIQRTPADQRGPLQEKMNQLFETAINEFSEARKVAPENEPNLHVVMYNLGKAYDAAGKYEEAAAALQKAAELKPTQAEYFMEWGTTLAKAGKAQEAGAACDKAVSVDKGVAASCWRNAAIVLQNIGKMKESVEPLRRSVELDPNYADSYFLLGRGMVAAMEYKKEGDKYITVVLPGTAEAYQKYLEMAPNGRFAAEAKAGLSMLEQLGAGIETKVKTRKK